MMLTLCLEYDQDAENPCDWDGWKVYSFNSRHASYRDPERLGLGYELDEDGVPKVLNPGLRSKLRHGLAFWLSYYEHGQCQWSLLGGLDHCPDMRWDGRRIAGLLVWEGDRKDMGAKDYEGRQKDAAGFVETYTCWCNGEVYGFAVEGLSGMIDSCWGFFGNSLEYMFQEHVLPVLKGLEYEVAGDAAWLAEYHLPVRKVSRAKPKQVQYVSVPEGGES